MSRQTGLVWPKRPGRSSLVSLRLRDGTFEFSRILPPDVPVGLYTYIYIYISDGTTAASVGHDTQQTSTVGLARTSCNPSAVEANALSHKKKVPSVPGIPLVVRPRSPIIAGIIITGIPRPRLSAVELSPRTKITERRCPTTNRLDYVRRGRQYVAFFFNGIIPICSGSIQKRKRYNTHKRLTA